MNQRLITLLVAIPLILLLFHFLSDGAVFNPANFVNLFKYVSVVGLLSIGMTLVIVNGHIDLSVGSGLGLLGAYGAYFLTNQQLPLPVVFVIGICLALTMGLIHGICVVYLKVPSFIVTLSGLMAYMGLKHLIANPVIPILNETYLYIGQGYLPKTLALVIACYIPLQILMSGLLKIRRQKSKQIPADAPLGLVARFFLVGILSLGITLVCNQDRGIPFCAMLMVVLAAIYSFLANKTRFGRQLYAVGSNPEAAYYAGVNTSKITILVFMLMAIMVLAAGTVATTQLMAGAPDIGDYQELYAIAACVLGGASLKGGTGSIWMSLLGAVLMASILNGMEQVGIASPVQKLILGLILTTAVALDKWALHKKSGVAA